MISVPEENSATLTSTHISVNFVQQYPDKLKAVGLYRWSEQALHSISINDAKGRGKKTPEDYFTTGYF